MFVSEVQQSVYAHHRREMIGPLKPLTPLPWPKNLFGEYATITELLSEAGQSVDAFSANRDIGRLLSGNIQ
jgi:hypothetical protein